MIHHGFIHKKCGDCGDLMFRHHLAEYCFPCCKKRQKAASKIASKNHQKRYPLAHHAHSIVRKAVMNGELPSLKDGNTQCVDCEMTAKHYDHRDYTKPLDVEPVCIPCNFRRGPAYPYRPAPDKGEAA